MRKELRVWLRKTINKVGITSIFVTHDQEEAVEVADEIIITNKGRVEQIGTPVDIYKNPATPFAAKFIGESIEVKDYGRFHGFENEKGYAKAVLRPEFVRVTKIEKEIYPHASERGTVEDIFFRGNMLELRLNVGGVRLAAYRSLEDDLFSVGEEVSVLIYRLYLYNDHQVRLAENASLKSDQTFII